MSETKPPIELMPEWVWRCHRIDDLQGAINRYLDDRIYNDVVVSWINELAGHVLWCLEHESKRIG
jgi:hypothetical protein